MLNQLNSNAKSWFSRLNLSLTTLVTLAAGISLLGAGGVAHAAVILEVDVSDPSAVVFTSTAADAQTTTSNIPSAEGIVLSGFFSGNAVALSGQLLDSAALNAFDSSAGTTRQPLDQIFVDDFLSLTLDDLNIYRPSPDSFDMYFFDAMTALTGSASADLSALTGLQTVGTMGTVFAGDPNDNTIIGQWQVVPEPSTAALTALGLVGLAARRRRP